MVPCPSEREKLTVEGVAFECFPERASVLEVVCHLPVRHPVERRRLETGLHECPHDVIDAYGLKHADGGERYEGAVAEAACEHQDETHEGVQYQNLAGEESGVEASDDEQEHKAPAETQTEIVAAHALVVVLHEEAETEQQGENGVGFASESEEQTVPHGFVEEVEPYGQCRCVGILVEIEMFDGVEHDNGEHGKAAQGVGNVDAGMFFQFFCHLSNSSGGDIR